MATKATGPVWGLHPLHHSSGSLVWPYWGIHRDDDPVPILDSAKLHYCYSNVIGAAFSAPVFLCLPGTPLLSGCCLVWLSGCALAGSPFCLFASLVDLACLPLLVYSPLLSLRNEWMELRLNVRTSVIWLILFCLLLVLDGEALTQHSCDPLRWLRTAVLPGARKGRLFALPFLSGLTLFLLRGCLLVLTLIRLFSLGFLGMSSVWVLYMGSWIQPRGAVVSRPMPWTRLCCSELHRCIPVFVPVGQPGAPASSTRLPAWFVNWSKDVVILQPVYSMGEWHYSRSFATIFVGAYCNALQVLQGRWHPEMSWTVL